MAVRRFSYVLLGIFVSCGPVSSNGSGGSGGNSSGGQGGNGGSGGTAGNGTGGSGGGPIIPNNCPSGMALPQLTGTVYAPNGADPLAGALVYVPMGQPQPLPTGNRCDACATVAGAWVQTHTGPMGVFH